MGDPFSNPSLRAALQAGASVCHATHEPKRRPNVVFVIESVADQYHRDLTDALSKACHDRDLNLKTLVLTSTAAPIAQHLRDHFLSCLSDSNAVGVVIAASATNGSGSALLDWAKHHAPVPVSCIGRDLGAGSAILVKNREAIEMLVGHLGTVHRFTRVGYIGGPSTDADARERLDAYLGAMHKRGLEVREDWLSQGDFMRTSGARAVHDMAASASGLPRAIVAANDGMALGAMEALSTLGLRVPDDVAVTGFDDLEGARRAPCPLTSISYPWSELADAAIDQLLHPGTHTDRVNTRIAVRRSCGCSVDLFALPELTHRSPAQVDWRRVAGQLRRSAQSAGGHLSDGWSERLTHAFSKAAEDPERCAKHFLGEFKRCLFAHLPNDPSPEPWEAVIAALHSEYAREASRSRRALLRFETELLRASALIPTVLANVMAERRATFEVGRRAERYSAIQLASCESLAELQGIFPSLVAQTGATWGYLFACLSDSTSLLVGHHSRHAAQVYSRLMEFPKQELDFTQLLPPMRHSAIVLPVYAKQHLLGMLIADFHKDTSETLEGLSNLLGIALRSIALADTLPTLPPPPRRPVALSPESASGLNQYRAATTGATSRQAPGSSRTRPDSHRPPG